MLLKLVVRYLLDILKNQRTQMATLVEVKTSLDALSVVAADIATEVASLKAKVGVPAAATEADLEAIKLAVDKVSADLTAAK